MLDEKMKLQRSGDIPEKVPFHLWHLLLPRLRPNLHRYMWPQLLGQLEVDVEALTRAYHLASERRQEFSANIHCMYIYIYIYIHLFICIYINMCICIYDMNI